VSLSRGRGEERRGEERRGDLFDILFAAVGGVEKFNANASLGRLRLRRSCLRRFRLCCCCISWLKVSHKLKLTQTSWSFFLGEIPPRPSPRVP